MIIETAPTPDEPIELAPGMWTTISRHPAVELIGADVAPGTPDPTAHPVDELYEIAKLASPGSSGVTFKLELDDHQQLQASMCVDGKCYRGSADMSGILGQLTAKIATYHKSLHDDGVTAPPLLPAPAPDPSSPSSFEASEYPASAESSMPPQDDGNDGYAPSFEASEYAPGATEPQPDDVDDGSHDGGSFEASEYPASSHDDGNNGDDGYASSFEASEYSPATIDPTTDPVTSDVQQASETAAQVVGQLLVGALVDHHCTTMSAGFFGSVWSGFRQAHHAMAKVVTKLKVPVTIAATAVATAYGGPAAGAAAAKLSGPVIDMMEHKWESRDEREKREAAEKKVEAVDVAVADNPEAQKAVETAKSAIVQTAAAYHLTDTADRAAKGDQDAAKQVAALEQRASQGDSTAVKAMSIIAQAFMAAAQNDANGGVPPGHTDVSTDRGGQGFEASEYAPTQAAGIAPWLATGMLGVGTGAAAYAAWRLARGSRAYGRGGTARGASPVAVSGQAVKMAIEQLRGEAVEGALASHHQGAPAIAYVKDGHGSRVWPFMSLDEADSWLTSLDKAQYLYAAYFDPYDQAWPTPIRELMGTLVEEAATKTGGVPWPLLAVPAGIGLGYLWRRHGRRGRDGKKAA